MLAFVNCGEDEGRELGTQKMGRGKEVSVFGSTVPDIGLIPLISGATQELADRLQEIPMRLESCQIDPAPAQHYVSKVYDCHHLQCFKF